MTFAPACGTPACGRIVPGPPSNAFEEFLADPNRAGRFLVEIDLFPKSAAPITRNSLPACGAPACALGDQVGETAQAIQLSLSDHFIATEPDDSLRPNLVPKARLAQRIDIDTSFSIIPNSSVAGQVLVGDVEVFNADGWVDTFLDEYNVDGQEVHIRFGPENGAYSEFRIVEDAFGRDWQGDTNEIRLTLQDLQFRLDQPYQTAAYAGTGGTEGISTLTGRLKPRLIGRRYNFEPILIDPANGVYQISDGPIEQVLEVRDGALPLDASGVDVSTYGLLISEDLEEGQWATALNLGLFRVRPAGGSLASVLTVEALGDNTNEYTQKAGSLIIRELRNRAGYVDVQIDNGSFGSFNAFDSGYWFSGANDNTTFRDVVNDLTKQTGGRITADSKIRGIRIVDPQEASFNFEVDENEIFELEPAGMLFNPVLRTTVRYRPNDRPISDNEIVGTLDDDKRDLQREFQEFSYQDSSVLIRSRSAQQQLIIETDLVDDGSAAALAASVGRLWSQQRLLFRIRLSRRALFFAVGSILKVTHSRYGFGNGKNGLIVQRLNDYNAQQAELTILV